MALKRKVDMSPFDVNQIQNFRITLNMTQRAFAAALRVPQSSIYRWEAGIISPNAKYIGALYDLGYKYGVDPKLFPHPQAKKSKNEKNKRHEK